MTFDDIAGRHIAGDDRHAAATVTPAVIAGMGARAKRMPAAKGVQDFAFVVVPSVDAGPKGLFRTFSGTPC